MKQKQRSDWDDKGWKLTFFGGSDIVTKQEKKKISNNFKGGLPLSEVHVGQTVKAIAIEDSEETRRFLVSQGLKPGKELRVESRTNSGSVTVIVGNRLLSLGAVIARKVIVIVSDRDKLQP